MGRWVGLADGLGDEAVHFPEVEGPSRVSPEDISSCVSVEINHPAD